MKGNAKEYVSTAQQFFTAYDAHDVHELNGGAKSQSPTTDYMKAREVGNGFSRNQSTRHSSGSRCD